MNDNVKRTPNVTDEQMDLLLQTFYQKEMPDRLEVPPSQWTELQSPVRPVAVAVQTESAPTRPVRTYGRGFAVAIATLAMGLMVIVFSRPMNNAPDIPQQAEVIDDGEELMNVSEAADGTAAGVVGADDTTLQEIDAIDLSSESEQEPEARKN